ncbi:uncharacterized protein LOC134279822 [Saccostrea cucullata]|uniref:uncharacterized protein LOC134279822 n=1 Tax=Saccostrea cuccullata TaxID=36930 RepID=UPI002ED0BB27
MNPVDGISLLSYSSCRPSISTDKKFPKVGDDVKIVAKYCQKNENHTIRWRKCGELVGICVQKSCSQGANIKNDPSNLESTLIIQNASISKDNCHVTFIADGDEYPIRINIYKHPKLIIQDSNVINDTEIHLHGVQFVYLNVETSCMYPRPTLNVVYKDEHLLRSTFTIDGIDTECKRLEVSTFASFNISAKELKEVHLQGRGTLTASLVYAGFSNTIFNWTIVFDQNNDGTQGTQNGNTGVDKYVIACAAVIVGVFILSILVHYKNNGEICMAYISSFRHSFMCTHTPFL